MIITIPALSTSSEPVGVIFTCHTEGGFAGASISGIDVVVLFVCIILSAKFGIPPIFVLVHPAITLWMSIVPPVKWQSFFMTYGI